MSLTLTLAACKQEPAQPPAPKAAAVARPQTPSVRMTMAALHANGGVPPRWNFTVPPGDSQAGHTVFADSGCGSCHAIKGEPFEPTGVGPDLTGMGSHHPVEYFVESIVNPDAVIVEGPGYSGPDGRSIMPSYPQMTIAQVTDIVAYLKSLTGPEMPAARPTPPNWVQPPQPTPPPQNASVFYVQVYAVKEGQLRPFEEWFRKEGAPKFLAHDGLVSIETYVDGTRDVLAPSLVTILGFKNEPALSRFLADPEGTVLGSQFDTFIGPHQHLTFASPPIYRAPSLCAQ